jgi:hypothetical protein
MATFNRLIVKLNDQNHPHAAFCGGVRVINYLVYVVCHVLDIVKKIYTILYLINYSLHIILYNDILYLKRD